MTEHGWIGVDFDGTLAVHTPGQDPEVLGAPVPAMVERVKAWLAEGQEVRLVTARVAVRPGERDVTGQLHTPAEIARQVALIEAWCLSHLGTLLPITASKDFQMITLWDDRCVQVIPNTGQRADDATDVLKELFLAVAESYQPFHWDATIRKALDRAKTLLQSVVR